MTNVFEIAINLYQGCLIVYFCDRFHSGKRNLPIAFLCALLAGAFLCIHQYYSFPFPDSVVFIFGYLYLHITKRSSIWGRFFCCILLTVIWIATSMVFISVLQYVFHFDSEAIFSTGKMRAMFLLTFNILITVVLFLICNVLRRRQPTRMPFSCSLLFTILLMGEWFTSELLFSYITQNAVSTEPLLFYSILSLLCILIFSIVLYEFFCIILIRAIHAENQSRMLADSQKHQQELKNMYQVLLKNQHDFKHRLSIAEALISTKKDSSKKAISELLSENKCQNNFFLTGNESVDALLTVKKEIAEVNGIEFRYVPYPLNRLPIDDVAFCILVSNLLDNAIQEQLRFTDMTATRYVELKFSKSRDMFFISCINPTVEEKIDLSFSNIQKKQNNGHGFGLASIRQTIEENQGIIRIEFDEHLFKVNIMIPVEGD